MKRRTPLTSYLKLDRVSDGAVATISVARVESLVPVLGGAYHQSAVLEDGPLVVRLQRPDILEEPLDGIGVLEGAVKHRRFTAFRDQVPRHDLYRGGIVARDNQREAFRSWGRSSLVLRQTAVHPAVLGHSSMHVKLLLLDLDTIAPHHRLAISGNHVQELEEEAS